MPKVSVILTSYNHDKYLREAFESVLNQTFQDFELIIWDDASVDDSWQIIQSYSDPRIQAFQNQQNQGPVFGINKAIFDVARGDYIAIHHSDDVWELDKLEKQVAFLNANPETGAVFTWVKIIDEHGFVSTEDWFDQDNKARWQWLNQLFFERNHLCHPSMLIRKQCYQDVGVYRDGLAQTTDAEMWSRVLIKFPIHVIQEKLTKHRKFSDNSNVSGYSIDSVIRANNEWNVLRKNYLSIANFEDIVATFPSLERFRNPDGFDNKFLLAMACLYECSQRSAWQLGLTWLFELIDDKTRYEKIKKLYSFSHLDFMRLTAEFDVYELHSLVELGVQVTNLNQTISEREQHINAYRLQAEQFEVQLPAANTQIINLDQALQQRDEQIINLNQALQQRDEQIINLNQALQQRDEQIANLNRAITSLDNEITALRNSTSWRITKPVRFVSRQLSGLKLVSLGKRAYRKLTVNLNKLPEGFDGDVYLKLNPDVVDAGFDPAMHYLLDGCREGRAFSLSALESCGDNDLKPNRESSLVVRHELIPEPDRLPEDFDKDMYLKLNPDVAKAGVDPALHYLLDGCFEGRAFSLPALELCGDHNLKPDRDSILVVRHELIPKTDRLPEDFDKVMYLKLNPDVAKAGVDPVTHYLRGGFQEGRLYTLPKMTIYGDYDFKPDRETILVVSHEASRTGAPMLSLNIVQAFVKSYNVVALLLGGGPLSDAFKLSGAAVIESFHLRSSPILANGFVSQLCGSFIFKFALVNSIESRAVLPSLGNCFVPVISLIHEFASYTRPRDAFRDALFWSGEVVFSANVTMENARAEYPDLGNRSAHILPQGRCLLPLDGLSEGQHQAEKTHIHRLIRPKGLAEDAVIVLGAGSVQLRKGVDLFIECAARVVNGPDGNRCRFVWIGNGYDPDNDVGYSVYLADQIRRAGLQRHVLFIDETAAIETAYEEADLLLLSSRLDPLPNVAIDAMAHGVPVLCFDKTTGIADFLIRSGLGDHCVADYIDSSNMAKKILALAGSQTLRKNVAEQCYTASIAYFNMDNYVASLEILAKTVSELTQQEKTDTKTILDSGLFRRDFSCPPYQQGQSIEDEVRLYVRAWASGIIRRKPFPGFHPGIFKEQHGLATQGVDPFADYLRAGQPKGSWNYPVIVAQEADVDELPVNHRVALHLHIYYPDLLPEIIMRLACNRICPDLYVSITDENVRQWVVSQLCEYKGNVVDIQLVPNSGRDIGPLLTAFGPSFLANYDFVGHIHTKKTVSIKDAAMAEFWYKFLLKNLLGGESVPMADGILARMNNDASIGMVFPDDPWVVGWGANRAFAEPLAERMGLAKLPEHFVFPVGSMFWARISALAPFMDLKLGWDDYPEEPLPYDGTSLHALERLFSLYVSENNLRCATTNVVGLTR